MDQAQKIYQLIIDAGGSKQGADLFKRAADQISEAAAKAAAAGKPLVDNVAAAEKAYRSLVTRIDPVTTAQVRMAKEITVVQQAFAAQKITVEQAATSLQQITTRYEAVIDRAKRLGASNSGGMFRNIGFAAQQAGYQIGDFAVQVASGQGVMRPLIQQGTQLISMFGGPWGAALGAAAAVAGSLAVALWDVSSASKDATNSNEKLLDVLKDMDTIQKQLGENDKRNRASLQAQLDYDLSQVQKRYDTIKAKVDAEPKTVPTYSMEGVATGGEEANPIYADLNKQLITITAQLETAKMAAGQFQDSFARAGTDTLTGNESTKKSIQSVTAAMEEQLRVLRLERTEREADKIVDQKLAELGFTRASAGKDLLKTLTDLATAQVKQTQANKDGEEADRKAIENAKSTSAVLSNLKKQYDDLTKAPFQIQAENLFAGKIPTPEQLQQAEAMLKKIDDFKTSQAADKQNRSEIDQIIEQATRSADQRQKQQQDSLQNQQDQLALLKMQLSLSAANDNEAERQLAVLKATQEVHAQMGTTLDANAQKYIQNAEAIVTMNQQLRKQQAEAAIIPDFLDRTVDRIGEVNTALATQGASWASLRGIAMGVLSEIGQTLLQLSVLNPIKNWISGGDLPTAGGLLGGFSGLFGPPTNSAGFRMTGAGPGASANTGGGFFSGIGSWFSNLFRDGGVMTPQGPLQLRRYAAGGVANSPQAAIFGEGDQPEAYVPLNDGRSIPVSIRSGGRGANQNDGQWGSNVVHFAPVYQIDARGAAPGTAAQLEASMRRIATESINGLRASVDSGGADAKRFGRRRR